MIYTSYFSSRRFPINLGVAITLGGKFWKGDVYKALAPTPQILNWWKNERQKWKNPELVYEKLYIRDVLNKLDVHQVAKDLNGKVLLCFEKEGDFCHRHIVAKWLSENGYECHEVEKGELLK